MRIEISDVRVQRIVEETTRLSGAYNTQHQSGLSRMRGGHSKRMSLQAPEQDLSQLILSGKSKWNPRMSPEMRRKLLKFGCFIYIAADAGSRECVSLNAILMLKPGKLSSSFVSFQKVC